MIQAPESIKNSKEKKPPKARKRKREDDSKEETPTKQPKTNSSSEAAQTSSHDKQNVKNLPPYKTVLCRHWQATGKCEFAEKCRFAHGEEDKKEFPPGYVR